MNRWIDDLQHLASDGQQCVVVTVAGVRGSAPREVGAKMIVTANETMGTIGGGQLEYQCTRIAAQQLQKKGAYDVSRLQRRFPLGANCGQCCGGVVDVLFERVAIESDLWLTELRQLHCERRPVVVVTPLAEETGKYLITNECCTHFATGNACPDTVTGAAKKMIDANDSAEVVDGFLLEPVLQSDFHVAIFGAGHVGAATIDVLSRLDCNIRWIDSRRSIFPAQLPNNVMAISSGNPVREISAMPSGASYLVMTHSHPLDYEICDQVLRRGDAAYCGLIGSIPKRRRFERDLRKQGLTDSQIERLTCPIGVSGIEGKKPADIAIAVAAELLRIRDAAGAANADNVKVCDNVHVL